MVTLNAHFDGRVIVPDEPLDLRPNQRVRVIVEPIETEPPRPKTDWHALIGTAGPWDGKPYDPSEEDALWEDKGPTRPDAG